MNAIEPMARAGREAEAAAPPFDIARPPAGTALAPLVFASPHSGRLYPDDMMAAARLSGVEIRRSEDVLVDRLIAPAVRHGATVISARYARAYVDVNREACELDPAMFEGAPPAALADGGGRGRTARVAAGLGAVPRVVGDGQEIYDRKLPRGEAERRLAAAHAPWHAALNSLVSETRARHGLAILVDWHSMPSAAARLDHLRADGERRRRGCDMVLGDRFGVACAPAVTRLAERELERMGYLVARNAPYAGGYTTEHHGRPADGVHALQIEINRALYLDEDSLEPTDGFARLQRDLGKLTAALATADWARLI